ncbi:hypothetical protein D3C77_285040 [compost metagenome]
MKCPDVIEEWMNLYVDHALGDEEETLLMQHIETCPECAEKFMLLKDLSASLEQLPMATPSYDLVDAILPQLQMIDQARMEEASTSGVVPIPTDKAINRRKRSRYFRTGVLGTAVAAAIFGLVIFNHEINKSREANSLIDEQSIAIADQDFSANTNQSSSDQLDETKEAATSMIEKNKETTTMPTEQSQSQGDKALEGHAEQQDQKLEDEEAPKSPVATDDKKAPVAKVDKEKKDTPVQTPSKVTNSPKTSNESGITKQDQGSADQSQNQNDFGEPMLEQETFDQRDMHIGMGITSMISQWISPDGLYSVELNDAHLYLYSLSMEEGKVLLTDQGIEGAWISGAWLPDELSFSYQTDVDGEVKSFSISPEVKAENK